MKLIITLHTFSERIVFATINMNCVINRLKGTMNQLHASCASISDFVQRSGSLTSDVVGGEGAPRGLESVIPWPTGD